MRTFSRILVKGPIGFIRKLTIAHVVFENTQEVCKPCTMLYDDPLVAYLRTTQNIQAGLDTSGSPGEKPAPSLRIGYRTGKPWVLDLVTTLYLHHTL